MTQTNTTQNKEELDKLFKKDWIMERWGEKIDKWNDANLQLRIVYYDGKTETYSYTASYDLIKADLEKLLSQAHQSGIEEERKRIKTNIGFLRQFINEMTTNGLITNKQIEYWLFESLKENTKASKG